MTFDIDDRKRRPKVKILFDAGEEGENLKITKLLIGVGKGLAAKEGESVSIDVTHMGLDLAHYENEHIKMSSSSPCRKSFHFSNTWL